MPGQTIPPLGAPIPPLQPTPAPQPQPGMPNTPNNPNMLNMWGYKPDQSAINRVWGLCE